MTVDPMRTRVLAVGIERYGCGDAWDLPGSGEAARRFAKWALCCGVPPDHVTLACSWVDTPHPAAPDGVVTTAPTLEGVRDALAALRAAGGELLLLFWCGHGVVDERRRSALYTADATAAVHANLDVNALLMHLETAPRPAFRHQVVLIDACANFVEDMRYDERLPSYEPQLGDPRDDVRQFAFFSAAQGRIAAFDRTRREAAFSAAALAWLEAHAGDGLPPDDRALAAHVEDALSGLGQTPVFRIVRSAGGSWVTDGTIPVSGRAFAALSAAPLDVSQARRIAYATVALVEQLGPAGRSRLQAALHGDAESLDDAVLGWCGAELPRVLDDLRNDVATEEEWLAVEDLRALHRRHLRVASVVRAVTAADPVLTSRQVREAFFRVVPPDVRTVPEGLSHALELAAEHGLVGEDSPLLRFVAELEHATGACVPDAWFGLDADRLRALRERAREVPGEPALLVVDLTGPIRPGRPWTPPDTVDGHLRVPGGGWTKTTVACEATTDGLHGALQQLLDFAAERSVARFRVGLIAPRALIDQHPESWEVGSVFELPRPLWQTRPAVLHFAERRASPDLWLRAAERAAIIMRRVEAEVPEIDWLQPELRGDLHELLRRASGPGACCGLGFAPGAFGGEHRRDALAIALSSGAPFLLWNDDDPDDRPRLEADLLRLLRQGFGSLADQLHGARAAARTSTVGAVRVVWDDPDGLPPMATLAGPEAA